MTVLIDVVFIREGGPQRALDIHQTHKTPAVSASLSGVLRIHVNHI